ncbi:MAG TPA: YbhB/YbcL family Raf kinase inhibitor-like protein [Rectinemataceae bacterium]|nr:YbhB/YbcL family Raf kinase inhibitor-like protein [Rectinemataceae bacterium]
MRKSAVVTAVLIAAAASLAGAQGFGLSTTALVGAGETGFDSGIKASGSLDGAYAAKPGAPGNPRSFPFSWSNLPTGTKALALVLDDPDARLVLAAYGMKGDAFLHWIAADIDPGLGGLGDNASATAAFPQGKNGAGTIGYTGPQPPTDLPKEVQGRRIHVYRLKVFALSSPTGLKNGFSLDELLAAVKGRTLGTAELDLSYSNQ